jgi:hypothetical protein
VCLTLRPTVSRPVCLGIKHPSGACNQIFITVGQLRVCCSFKIADGPRQRSHFGSDCRAARDHILLSQFETSLSSPPTTRRATVDVFDPAFTQDCPVLIISFLAAVSVFLFSVFTLVVCVLVLFFSLKILEFLENILRRKLTTTTTTTTTTISMCLRVLRTKCTVQWYPQIISVA